MMAWQVYLVKKDTEVRPDLRDLLDPQERMEKGETMARSDPGVCLVNQVLVVCWDLKDHRDHLDHLG